MNLPLIVHKDGTIYFYKKMAKEKEVTISKYLKENTIQIKYTENLEIYRLEDFSIVSLILNNGDYIGEFISFLNEYSYNEIPYDLIEHIRKIKNDIKLVSLELGKTEIIIRVMKGDLSFLTKDKKINEKIKINEKQNFYSYPREDNYKLIEYLADKKVNMMFPYVDVERNIDFQFKESIKLRYYQKQAFEALKNRKRGLTVMPVASGKTYLAIKLIEYLKKETLILCENKDNCFRWKKTLLKFLNVASEDIQVCVDESSINKIGKINIYSYDILRSTSNKSIFERLYDNDWGVIIYDNAHKVVTKKAIELLYLKACYKFAFDSTLNRSDGREQSLLNLFGGITYNITSDELVNNLYQKKLECYKVDLRVLQISKEEFIKEISNRIKMKRLVIVAYSNDEIRKISDELKIRSLNQFTKHKERINLIHEFNTGKINRLCISNLIANYPITNIDIMIAAGYRGSGEIEENFRIGALVSTVSKLMKISVVQMFYLIKNDKEYEKIRKKETSLRKYGINLKILDIGDFMGGDNT